MKKVAVRSCLPSMDRIRGTPTSGPYAWWLIGVIRVTDEMSAVSIGASASMSKVRQAAAVTPRGQRTGAGGTALLRRDCAGAGPGGSAGVIGSSKLVVAGQTRDLGGMQPSDQGANSGPAFIPWYETPARWRLPRHGGG